MILMVIKKSLKPGVAYTKENEFLARKKRFF